MVHWLVACGTLEEEFKCFSECISLATGRFATVELVVFFVPKPCFQFFKNTTLLVEDEAFQLVGLEPPMENKPACFFVTGSPKPHERVVVKSVKGLANGVKAYFGLIRDLDVRDLVNTFEDFGNSDCVFPK